MKRQKNLRGMIIKLIGRGWAKYRYLSVQVASRSIICQSRRLGQIIDLRDTGKSRCFAITESNNCFIFHWSPSLFLNYLESDLCHCQARAIARRRKAWFHYAWAEYYLQPYTKPNTVGRQTIICRQLFAGHLIGSRPMKRRKICIELKGVLLQRFTNYLEASTAILQPYYAIDNDRGSEIDTYFFSIPQILLRSTFQLFIIFVYLLSKNMKDILYF